MSTESQDSFPATQRAVIEAWAVRDDVAVVAWHDDLGISGGAVLEDRPGLMAAIEAVRAQGAGLLAVARRDRLARDVLTAALVERLCERVWARVVGADGTGNGDGSEAALLRTLRDAFAAYERALIRGRTRAALAVKKAWGGAHGRRALRVPSRGEAPGGGHGGAADGDAGPRVAGGREEPAGDRPGSGGGRAQAQGWGGVGDPGGAEHRGGLVT